MYPNLYRTRGLPRTLSANTKGFFNGLIGQKKPENDTEMIQNYRRYRHTSGNGRKDTAKGKAFYEQLMEQQYVAISATKDKRAVSLRGNVKNIGKKNLTLIDRKSVV